MRNVFIIHGTGGNPESNWFPWLRQELEKAGCKVFVPKFPTPENQSLKSWLVIFERYMKNLDENCIVVGHSLGVPFLLNILEQARKPIKAAFFVSAFTGLSGNKRYDDLHQTFVDKVFEWKSIRKKCGKFCVINSDNDQFIPLNLGQDIAKRLGAEFIVLNNAGHINQDSGYTKFEMLLEKIKAEL